MAVADGDHVSAAKSARKALTFDHDPDISVSSRYPPRLLEVAELLADCYRLAADDRSAAEGYAAEAVRLLRQALTTEPERRLILRAPETAPLRGRPDFEALVREYGPRELAPPPRLAK